MTENIEDKIKDFINEEIVADEEVPENKEYDELVKSAMENIDSITKASDALINMMKPAKNAKAFTFANDTEFNKIKDVADKLHALVTPNAQNSEEK
jgi:hypothetical protein